MKFIDFIKIRTERMRRDAKSREEKNFSAHAEEMARQDDEWRKQVTSRYYRKSDIVLFVQCGHDKNEKDVYFMCGYLNADGSKFRDLATGDVYDISEVSHPDKFEYLKERETVRSTISVDGNSFIQVDPTIWGPVGYSQNRSINIGVAGTAMSSEISNRVIIVPKEYVLYDAIKPVGKYSMGEYTRCLNLYNLLDKQSEDGLVSGVVILLAVNEANYECSENVKRVNFKRAQEEAERELAEEQAMRKRERLESAILTSEELDF